MSEQIIPKNSTMLSARLSNSAIKGQHDKIKSSKKCKQEFHCPNNRALTDDGLLQKSILSTM
jgi:hypothetical protein